MYFGVLCQFLLVYIILSFTYVLSVIIFHIIRIMCLFSALRKDKYEANQNYQS